MPWTVKITMKFVYLHQNSDIYSFRLIYIFLVLKTSKFDDFLSSWQAHWLRDKSVRCRCDSVTVIITLKRFLWHPKCQCGGGQGALLYYVCSGVWNPSGVWNCRLSYLPLSLGPWNFHRECIYVLNLLSHNYRERVKDLCSGDMTLCFSLHQTNISNGMFSQIPLDQLDCLF